jgi:tocopherol O-methyltransferase
VVHPGIPHDAATVPAHYDLLDRFYREIWGEHVHHGLWERGDESPERAARALALHVAGHLHGARTVCDVGCGYGGTSRLLAERFGAEVTGVTISPRQFEWARGRPAAGPAPSFVLSDWLEAGLPDASFDGVVAIESLSHIADKERAFAECARVLRPGGRLVVCDWLTAERPSRRARKLLLEPICREGRLPSMASVSEYAQLMRGVGLEVTGVEDLSDRVGRTWAICRRRLALRLLRDGEARRVLLGSGNPDRRFALSMFRIPVAYRAGAMRLALITANRPL